MLISPPMIQDSPIFILACSRSGSTLLRLALNSHPQVCSPPELHLLKLARRLLWTYRLTLGDQSQEGEDAWALAIPKTRRNIDQIMGEYCQLSDKRFWCEKSVTSVDHLDVLNGVFPEARLILLYRHPLDLVASGLKAISDRPDGYYFDAHLAAFPHNRVEALLRYWLDKTRAMLALEADSKLATRIRYEDLAQHPKATLEALATDLGLEPCKDWLQRIFNQDHQVGPGDSSVYERKSIGQESVGAGRSLVLTGVPRSLIRKINRCLESLCYDKIT